MHLWDCICNFKTFNDFIVFLQHLIIFKDSLQAYQRFINYFLYYILQSQKILFQYSVFFFQKTCFLFETFVDHNFKFFYNFRVVYLLCIWFWIVHNSIFDIEFQSCILTSWIYSHLPFQLVLKLNNLFACFFKLTIRFHKLLFNLSMICSFIFI